MLRIEKKETHILNEKGIFAGIFLNIIILQVKFNNNQAAFFYTLRSRVNDYFKTSKIKSTGNFKLYAKAAILLSSLIGLYIMLVFFTPNLLISSILILLLGFVMALIGFNIMHDGSHGSFSTNRRVNAAMAYTLNLLGANAFFWTQKHNVNHHTYTNIEGIDDDIDIKPFFRVHHDQPKKWFHKYQHIYGLFLYTVTFFFWVYYNDFKKYFTRKIAEHTVIKSISLKEHIIFWASKLIHISIFVAIPMFMVGVIPTIIGYSAALLITGLVVAVVFQLAHIVEDINFVTPEEQAEVLDVESDWAVHQMKTTANFATKSRILTWMLGGLNFQVEHHLFPRISHVHYPKLNEILKSTCSEFNVQYVEFRTMGGALRSHMLHLKKIGRE
ncbi:MAG: fatty acid desaturase [Bacteroidetes bacterium]|nr:fatty acid desaturase [Bacteroidota bacterium]